MKRRSRQFWRRLFPNLMELDRGIFLGLAHIRAQEPDALVSPALAAGVRKLKQFEAEASDEFKTAGHRIC